MISKHKMCNKKKDTTKHFEPKKYVHNDHQKTKVTHTNQRIKLSTS